MLRRLRLLSGVSSLFALGSLSCGPTLNNGMPAQPSAAESTDRVTTTVISGPTVPFIVDWKPEDRGDLEEAIVDGVAVVRFDTEGLRLLKRCHLAGDYGYLPLEPKKDVVRFDSARDLKANLPTGGAGLALKIGGGFEQGKTLDLAYVMIGKRRTTWSDPTPEDLHGKCDGATHYVRAVTLGAFAMKTGARNKAEGAIEIFSASVGASQANSGEVSTSDGTLSSCEQADGTGEPPRGCRSLLRLELEPIAAAPPKIADSSGEAARIKQSREVDCGEGMVFANGICTAASGQALARSCNPNDFVDCNAQCASGDSGSCNQAGVLLISGKAGPVDVARAEALFEKACDGDSAIGCVNIGISRVFGQPSERVTLRDATYLDRGCRRGEASGCSAVGEIFMVGIGALQRDMKRAVRYFTLGCDGGDATACTNLGTLYMGAGGPEVPVNDKKSIELSTRACSGGVSTACGNTGARYEFGLGVTKNLATAETLFKRACQLADGDCLRLGILYQHGVGVARDEAKSKILYQASCDAVGARSTSGFPSLACYVGSKLYGIDRPRIDPEALRRTLDIMKPQCDIGLSRACSFYAVASHALGQPKDGTTYLKKGCSLGDPWACDLSRRMKN